MANKAGQKREAAQANIESDEGARRTRSKLAGEDVKDINGNKRATRSSSGYDSTPREVFEGNGYGASPAKKESTKGADSRRAASTPRKKINKKGTAQKVVTPKKSAKPTIITNGSKASPKTKSNSKSAQRRSSSSLSDVVCGVSISVRKKEVAENEASDDNGSDGPSYWLMKAEPESRIEKDKDVKFSIDDLKDASEPEAWDGEPCHPY